MNVGRPAADEREESDPAIADRRELILSHNPPLCARTRAAGLFLFLPLLAEMGFDNLVAKADYPGTKMVPCDAALLSLLALKLLRKERLSHIDDFNVDEALGLFAGLNVLAEEIFCHGLFVPHPASATTTVARLVGEETVPAAHARGESLLVGLSSDSLSRRRGRVGKSLHSLSRRGGFECANILRARAQKPGVLLCKCQSHSE